jgi:hypothetical protein
MTEWMITAPADKLRAVAERLAALEDEELETLGDLLAKVVKPDDEDD